MTIRRKLVLSLLILVTLLSSQSSVVGFPGFGERRLTLSRLRIGDAVDIDYTSSGCFHWARYKLTIDGAKPSILNIKRLAYAPSDMNQIAIYQMELTGRELNDLDQLLSYYRSRPDGGCTTVNSIYVVWRLRDQWNEGEWFTDASCGQETLFPILLRAGVWP